MKFWKNNRIDGEYELSPEEICYEFGKWLDDENNNEIYKSWPLLRTVCLFSSTLGACDSVDDICEIIRSHKTT